MPLASVIMPVRATPQAMLREAIGSILSQTHSNLELIIVEDPSEAVRTDVVGEFQDERIRYHLNEQTTGLVAQRNLGLELSRGEFIIKADSDDVSLPTRLEKQTLFLQQNRAIDLVGSFLILIDEDGRRLGSRTYPTEPDAIYDAMRRRNVIAQPAACFRRSLVEQYGGYSEGFPVCQDYAYWSRLARKGVRFANLPESLVCYRQHAASIKSRKLRETLDATLRIKRQYWRDEMTLRDRTRMFAEATLRYAPAAMVQRLFRAVTYRR